jgi:predicted metallo-beta-lactamase superfamily hydrolase
MRVEIIGTESLGVRGLCCVVRTRDRKVVIDPGVALGFRRHGLMPHPVQVIASERTKSLIEKALEDATDIVISHYHGDHIPLIDANPYQLSMERVARLCATPRLWTKGTEDISYNQVHRAKALSKTLGRILQNAEGKNDGPLAFSLAVPHGEKDGRGGSVMMTRVEEDGEVFVHASDIQMLNDKAIKLILTWQPNVVLASGPAIYLPSLTVQGQEDALRRALRLAKEVDTLILDHHLMRSKKGEQWLDHVSSRTGRRVICAADFMGIPRNLLEAERVLWYKKLPVPEGWHRAYAQGEIDVISEWSDRLAQARIK